MDSNFNCPYICFDALYVRCISAQIFCRQFSVNEFDFFLRCCPGVRTVPPCWTQAMSLLPGISQQYGAIIRKTFHSLSHELARKQEQTSVLRVICTRRMASCRTHSFHCLLFIFELAGRSSRNGTTFITVAIPMPLLLLHSSSLVQISEVDTGSRLVSLYQWSMRYRKNYFVKFISTIWTL